MSNTHKSSQRQISPKRAKNSQNQDNIDYSQANNNQQNEKDVEIEHLKYTILVMNQRLEVFNDVKQDSQSYKQNWENAEQERDKLNSHIYETTIKIQSNQQENKQFQDQLIQENDQLKQEIERLHKKLNEQDLQNKRQQQQILEQNTIIIKLKETLKQKESVEDQLQKMREQYNSSEKQREKLQKDLLSATEYMQDLEDKVYKANKTSLELLKQLKDSEMEIETLKNYIIDLKQRIAVYIPVKDDFVDKKLAEFINNYPERSKLKIMFMRESEGVYQFGTKRVAVRVDKDKINIRVGGGYLSIDEFLDQYTPAELEKLERKDPLKKFSEKVAIQKTIVGKELREQSPIRSPHKSKSPRRNN